VICEAVSLTGSAWSRLIALHGCDLAAYTSLVRIVLSSILFFLGYTKYLRIACVMPYAELIWTLAVAPATVLLISATFDHRWLWIMVRNVVWSVVTRIPAPCASYDSWFSHICFACLEACMTVRDAFEEIARVSVEVVNG